MGIGRRKFIKLSMLALSGLTVDPLSSVITNKNAYVNRKMGILFFKPKNWGYIAVKDFGKLKQEQILGNGLNEFKDEIWEELDDPICVATKYHIDLPEYKGIFSPTITLHVTHKEQVKITSFEEVIDLSAHNVSQILTDFRILKRHPPYKICGCKFHEFDAEYLFEHVDIKDPVKVELKAIKAEHNNFYYDFNCHQSKEQNQIAQIEFEEFKKSIKLI